MVQVPWVPRAQKSAGRYIGVEAMPGPAAECQGVGSGDRWDMILIFLVTTCRTWVCRVWRVLEHLVNPWDCLKRHLDLLADDGLVAACIPNVQHWSVIASLLSGEWPLEDQGIFDRTHLRWFTKSSIEKLIGDLDLSMHHIQPRVFGVEKSKAFVTQLAPGLQSLGLDPQTVLNGVAPLQYVLSAGRHSQPKLQLHGHSEINPVVGRGESAAAVSGTSLIAGGQWAFTNGTFTFQISSIHREQVFVWCVRCFNRCNRSHIHS